MRFCAWSFDHPLCCHTVFSTCIFGQFKKHILLLNNFFQFPFRQTRRSQTSLTIEWKKPYDNGAAITSYNVDISGRKLLPYVPEKIENADNASDGETVAFTLLDLQPNTQYR